MNSLSAIDHITAASSNSDIFFDAFDTISDSSSSNLYLHLHDAIVDECGARHSSIDLHHKDSQDIHHKIGETREISKKMAKSNANLDKFGSSLDPSASDSCAFDKSCYIDSGPTEEHVSEITSLVIPHGCSTNFLIKMALLTARIIVFQVSIWIGFLTFPLSVLYYSYIFVTDPFRLVRMIVESVMSVSSKAGDLILKIAGPAIGRCWEEYMSVLRMILKVGWGLLWIAYICFILGVLLVLSVVMSSMVMRMVLQEPLHKEEALHFDYTQINPVAFAHLTSFPSSSCGANFWENNGGPSKGRKERVIPPHHRFMITLSLTLPESDYNRDLGIFQVRVEAVSREDKVLASSTQPCMFPFSSHHLRMLSTLFNLLPLLSGYRSESHTLKIRLRDFVEGDTPTCCFRVALQKRAAGAAGIPQIYGAHLLLDSRLPFLKHTLWSWKTTLFIWTTMAFFSTQFLFIITCSTSTIFPKTR